jgi:hypothetical protein
MKFAKDLEPWSVAEIVERLGCPERIAFMWKQGKRQPRPWAQKLYLRILRQKRPKTPGVKARP